MDLDQQTRAVNRAMVAFDLVLGSATLLAPRRTLRVLGHDEPSPDAEQLFRRCGPIWLTYAAAHLAADRRDRPSDWWALAWLRSTELLTDVVWAESPAIRAPRSKWALRLAGLGNLALTLQFARLARRS